MITIKKGIKVLLIAMLVLYLLYMLMLMWPKGLSHLTVAKQLFLFAGVHLT